MNDVRQINSGIKRYQKGNPLFNTLISSTKHCGAIQIGRMTNRTQSMSNTACSFSGDFFMCVTFHQIYNELCYQNVKAQKISGRSSSAADTFARFVCTENEQTFVLSQPSDAGKQKKSPSIRTGMFTCIMVVHFLNAMIMRDVMMCRLNPQVRAARLIWTITMYSIVVCFYVN